MKKFLFLSLVIILASFSASSQTTFNILVKDSLFDHQVNDAIEVSSGGFITVDAKRSGTSGLSSRLVKVDRYGHVLATKEVQYSGMPSAFSGITAKSDDELFLCGSVLSGGKTNLWLAVLDSSLEVKHEKMIPFAGYNLHFSKIKMMADGTLLCFGTLRDTSGMQTPYAFIYRFSKSLDSLGLKLFTDFWGFGLDLLERNDFQGFYYAGLGLGSGSSAGKILTLDNNFIVRKTVSMPDIANFSNLSYMDSAHILATGEYHYTWPSTDLRDMGVLAYDTSFRINHSIKIGKKDTEDFPALTKNIAFSSVRSIFLGGTSNMGADEFSMLDSWYFLNNVDTSLNVNWQKFFGGDGFYTLYGVLPASDSGCFMFGTFWDYHHIQDHIRYLSLVKVNKNGLLLGVDGEPSSLMKDVIIYPNPGNDMIWVMTQLSEASIEFMDLAGKTVLRRQLSPGRTQIETSELKAGMYIYRVFNKSRQIQTGKWIKN